LIVSFLRVLLPGFFLIRAMSLFGTIPFGKHINYEYGAYNENSNFSSFASTLITLFTVRVLPR
jgi:hypothetical protein